MGIYTVNKKFRFGELHGNKKFRIVDLHGKQKVHVMWLDGSELNTLQKYKLERPIKLLALSSSGSKQANPKASLGSSGF